ncbi:MAG: C4-type zinc ribbon domain-containing protein [Bacteroidota bacterium]|nr:C4-type zinc ribbon domain-containing protein [Bacteroidota bacterium]
MEQTVEQKLEYLLKLQSIDSQIDQIKITRGDLPEEVRDIEDEVAGMQTRINNFNEEIKELDAAIAGYKNSIKESEKLIKKYEDQQTNVRNNREYDAISKEVELQKLEIQLCEKKIKESGYKIELKKKEIETTNDILTARKGDMEVKKGELDVLIAESEEEITKLMNDREKASKQVDERLFKSYSKLRNNYRNGLAVVLVKRDACGGCFNSIPPQRQAEIKERKKIIVCEHCGRILAGVETIVVPEAPVKKSALSKELKEA